MTQAQLYLNFIAAIDGENLAIQYIEQHQKQAERKFPFMLVEERKIGNGKMTVYKAVFSDDSEIPSFKYGGDYDPRLAYDDRKGMVSKSYKLPQILVNDFAEACSSRNKSQATILTELMKNYIKSGS